MEIISVRVGSPSQAPSVDIEKPTQVNAEVKNVTINTNGDGASNTVLYDPQDLTDAQKRQARENINAAGKDEIPTKTSQLTDDVGYAKQTEVSQLSEEIVDKIDTASATLGLHTDGLIYLCKVLMLLLMCQSCQQSLQKVHLLQTVLHTL